MRILKSQKYNVYRSVIINCFILLFFLLISMFNIIIIIHYPLMVGSDMRFHWQEILELMKSHPFPYYALNSFSYSGSAILTMYPYILLYPVVILFHIVSSVKYVVYIMFIINTFICLIISYYSSLSLNKKRLISLAFSLMYSFSDIFIITNFITSDIGIEYAIIFAPLVVFGFISLIKNGCWIMLSIGMSLIIFSNVLAAMFIPILLIILLILNINYINKRKVINIFKAIILTIISTAVFVMPAVKVLDHNELNEPNLRFTRMGEVLSQSFFGALKNGLNPVRCTSFGLYDHNVMTIYMVIGLITGLLFYHNLNYILKTSYIFSIIIIFICSSYFPWRDLLRKFPFIKTLQFTGRMYLLPLVILTYILACNIFRIQEYLPYSKIPILVVLVCIVLGMQIFTEKAAFNQKLAPHDQFISSRELLDQSSAPFDYYPKSSLSKCNDIVNHIGVYKYGNNNYCIYLFPKGNGNFKIFNNTQHDINDLKMPFLDYRGTEYQCLINSHYSKNYRSKHQLLIIPHIRKGISYIHIHPINNNIYLYISIIGLMIYIFVILRKFIK